MLYSWDICDQYMKVLLIEDELKTGQSIKSYLQEECKYEVIWHNDEPILSLSTAAHWHYVMLKFKGVWNQDANSHFISAIST